MSKLKYKAWLYIKRAVRLCALLVLLYLVILLVGLIPVNNDFQPAEHGVTIYVVSTEVHADIIVPKVTDVVDWRERFEHAVFGSDVSRYDYIAFGWGDKGFYLQTPTWNDLKLSTVAHALLLPSSTCMHVSYTDPGYYSGARAVTISHQQYRQLVEYLKSSLKLDKAGRVQQIAGYAYASDDAFFEAHGSYHLFNTCNSWAGRALQKAGVRTPLLTPLPGMPMLYFP